MASSIAADPAQCRGAEVANAVGQLALARQQVELFERLGGAMLAIEDRREVGPGAWNDGASSSARRSRFSLSPRRPIRAASSASMRIAL